MGLNIGVTQDVSFVNDTGDREACKKRWFVAETKMYHEKKVRDVLTKMGIECFLPSQIVLRQWKHRKTKVEQLLIPMKVFVHIEERDKFRVLNLHLVTRFMREWNKTTPVVVPDDQMSQFMFMLNYTEKPVCFSETVLELGVRVRVVRGPLQGLEGDFIATNGVSKIRVGMDFLGYISVEVPIEDIQVIR